MISFYTATEAAEEVGISSRRLRKLLQQGRVQGAEKAGHMWLIPPPVTILPPRNAAEALGERASDDQ